MVERTHSWIAPRLAQFRRADKILVLEEAKSAKCARTN